MSITGAMFAGVSALKSNAAAIGSLSDNVANINTVGFKRKDAQFSTLITGAGGAGESAPGGVKIAQRSLVEQQGQLQRSESVTDLAIDGNGFFVVSPKATEGLGNDTYLFTRAGSFEQASDGFLRNRAGYLLQAWPIDAAGNIATNPSDLSLLENVKLDNLGGAAEATSSIDINANLQASQAVSAAEATYDATAAGFNMASGTVTPDFQRTIQIFDSKGGLRDLTISLLKSATPNEWHAELHMVPAGDVALGAPLINGQIATGVIAFDTNGGFDAGSTTLPTTLSFLQSGTAPGAGQVAWGTALGISAQTVTMDFDSTTQFDAASALVSTEVDGSVFGALAAIDINDEGIITATFENGIQRDIYKLPIATFPSPNGLIQASGNAYQVSQGSGPFTLKEALLGGAGAVAPGALEQSNVDLSEEFTGLIITQRAYSAATRIITTADQMLDELIRIKR